MTLPDDVQNGLAQVARLLDDPALEPNPDRTDWLAARAALDHVQTTLERQVLARLGVLAGAGAGSGAHATNTAGADARRAVVDATGIVAATLHAAGDTRSARALFERAVAMAGSSPQKAGFAAALREPTSFTMLAHAHWLAARGKPDAAAERRWQVLQTTNEPALQAAAQEAIGEVSRGTRDPAATPRGSSDATARASLAMPRHAHREPGRGRTRTVLVRLAVAALILLALGVAGLKKYRNSPGQRVSAATDAAENLVGHDANAAGDAFADVIDTWYGKVDDDTLDRAADGLVRTALAPIREPFTVDQLDAARRAVARYELLPPRLRQGPAQARLARALLGWADQLGSTGGTASTEGAAIIASTASGVSDRAASARAALRLLDELARVDSKVDGTARRMALRRELAASMAADEPVGALRLYLENGGTDRASLDGAAALLPPVLASPSLLIDLEDVLRMWLPLAEKDIALAPLVERTRHALGAAQRRRHDAARQALLDEPDEAKLRAALVAAPSDQELTVALAEILAARGDTQHALELLGAFGKPGALVGRARVLLAQLLRDGGDLAGADAVLSGWLAWRLAPFQDTAQRFVAADRDARVRLTDALRSGQHDQELNPKVEHLSEAARDRFLAEWFEAKIAADTSLSGLRLAWERHADVVPASLLLGQVKLERARAAADPARATLLADAERAFLGIQLVAEGDPSYHLGLGQVYFRLGRPADGEKEFGIVRAAADPVQLMELADRYRELGMQDRARVVATEVVDDQDAPEALRDSAAVLLSILAVDEEEQEKWLRRAHNEQAGLDLLSLEGARLEREGKLAEADAKYAAVAEAWSKDARRSPISANNAALAMLARFATTGDVGHVDRAVALLEGGLRLEPDQTLVIDNLADLLDYRTRLRVLARHVDVRALRPGESETRTLIRALEDGPRGDEVRAALRKDVGLRRALELRRRQQALSPQAPGAYLREFLLLVELGDDAGMRAVVARVTGLSDFHGGESDEAKRRWRAGALDETIARVARARAARATRFLDAPGEASALTVAAAWLLLGNAELELARVGGNFDAASRAIVAFSKAVEIAPDLGSRDDLGWAQLHAGILATVTVDESIQALWKDAARRYPLWMAAWTVATSEHGRLFVSTLRLRPEARQAAASFRFADPGVADYAVAWLLGAVWNDDKLAVVFDRESTRLRYELTVRLFPDDEDKAAEARFFAARGQGTGAPAAATPAATSPLR